MEFFYRAADVAFWNRFLPLMQETGRNEPNIRHHLLPDHFLHDAMSELWRDELPSVSGAVLDASVHFGFAWGDSPYAGPSALVWADRDAGLAQLPPEPVEILRL